MATKNRAGSTVVFKALILNQIRSLARIGKGNQAQQGRSQASQCGSAKLLGNFAEAQKVLVMGAKSGGEGTCWQP
jgi:hypothetical protein